MENLEFGPPWKKEDALPIKNLGGNYSWIWYFGSFRKGEYEVSDSPFLNMDKGH